MAVPAKCGNWCRNILTRLVQHSLSLLQSAAHSKSSFHQDTKTGGGEFKGQSNLVSQIRQGTLDTLTFVSLSDEVKDWNNRLLKFSHCTPLSYFWKMLSRCYCPITRHQHEGWSSFLFTLSSGYSAVYVETLILGKFRVSHIIGLRHKNESTTSLIYLVVILWYLHI